MYEGSYCHETAFPLKKYKHVMHMWLCYFHVMYKKTPRNEKLSCGLRVSCRHTAVDLTPNAVAFQVQIIVHSNVTFVFSE